MIHEQNDELEILKSYKKELWGMKNKITVIKNLLEAFNRSLEQAEEIIRKLEDRSYHTV